VAEQISFFLQRARALLSSDSLVRDSLREALRSVCGMSIASDAISIRGNQVSLSVSPLLKNEIFIKKEPLLAEVRRLLPATPIIEIK